MEKKLSFEKVIGRAGADEKKQILNVHEKRFREQKFETTVLEGKEREKTKEEMEIISMANVLVDQHRKKYGLERFTIPFKNIHIIKKEHWDNVKTKDSNVAHYKPSRQAIEISESDVKLEFMRRLIHELVHFTTYQTLQIAMDDLANRKLYQLGLVISGHMGKKEGKWMFSHLNEAVTEEITKRIMLQIIKSSHPLFKEEIDALTAKDLINIDKTKFSYVKEREALNILIDKIWQKNRDEFKSREEVFNIFEEAVMTGRLARLSQLINKTFGGGTLKQLADLEISDKLTEEEINFIDNL